MTSFERQLKDGLAAIHFEDGVSASWTPTTGGQARQVVVAHNRETVVQDAGDSVALYDEVAAVDNDDIPPDTAQGGTLAIGGTSYTVLTVRTLSTQASLFYLSRCPIHGQQAVYQPPPPPTPVSYRGDTVTHNGEEVTYAGTL